MAQVSWQGALSNTTKNYVLRSPEAFDAGRYIGEEPRGLFGTIIDNTAGGLEGMVGGAANALGTAGKALYQTGGASRAIGEAGKWLVDRSIDLGERAAANARRSGLRQEYADQGLVDRITNPSYWMDSRGFVADASNMVGSMIPFAVTSAVLPEVGVAGLVSGVLGRGAARVGANKLARSLLLDTAEERGAARAAIGDFTSWAPTGVLDAASNTGEVAETLRAQGYSDADILPKMGTSFLYEIPYDIGSQGLFGALISGKGLRSALKGESRARNVAVNAGLAGADALNEGFQEHVQTQANELALGKPVGTLWNQTPEEASAFASGAIGGAVPLFGSAARNVLSNSWNGSGEVEQPELQTSAQEDPATMPVKSSGNADIDSIITDAAAELNVPVNLIHAVAQTESGYNQDARSEAGAIGVMQLMPETAEGLGVDPTDLRGNIYGGAKYLRQLMDTFGGDMQKVIAAYNAGPGAVQKYGGIPPYAETQDYVQKVMGNLDGYDLGASGDVPVQVRSLADDAAPFIGVTMSNGTEGCVEAVTKIGANSSAFLAQELKNGVVNVDRLVEDAGDNVIAFDPNQLEEGDVIVYGDESDPQRHVVLYDGKGGYIGNSSSRNQVVQGSDYNQMGDWHPTKIIKSGALFRGTSVRSISAPQMDFTGLVFDEKDIAATQKAINNLVHGGQPTPEQSAAILSAAEAIRDMPLGSVDKTAEAESYNEWQKLIDTKDIAGIVDQDPEGVARMVHQLAGAQKQQQTRAAIENQQQIEATKQAIAAVQQQRIEAAQARINNAVAQRNATAQDPQMQAEAPMQGAVQTPQIPMQTAPTNNIVGDTVVEDAAPQTFSSPVEEAAKSLPVSREELSGILGKVQQWEQPLLSIPAYVQARDRQDWATAAQIAANAGQPGVAQFYNTLMEHGSRNAQNVTPAPQENAPTVTPYAPQENVVAAPPMQNASAPIPVVGVRPLVPDRLPDSTTGRRDLAHALGRFMVANNIPISKGLRDDLSIGYRKAILYADEKIRKWENERAGNATQTAQGGAQSTETQADDRILAQRGERAQNGSKAVRGESAQNQGNKKAADKGELVLAAGYETESGRPLTEADPKEFIIKPNGSRNFGEITKAISNAVMEQSGVSLPIGEIRLRVGDELEGLIHAKEHTAEARSAGYDSVEDLIADVAENFNQIYMREPDNANGKPTYSLVRTGDKNAGVMNGVAPIYFELQTDGSGNYYIVISAIPKGDKSLMRQTKKDHLIYSSPGLGAATVSGNSAVSHDDKAGAANRGGSPTSDKSGDLDTSTISPEEAESKENPLHEDEQTALKGLSADAKDVYRLVRDKLADSSNKKVARAASVGAVLLARHADIIARKIRAALGKPFTAMDYYRNMFALKTEGDKTGANALHQAANADGKMYAQSATNVPSSEKEAVRKQYKGTAQWMKAPNGKPTNLTEDQWIAVRTPAFKAWFGDWENDPKHASKVVDENGEPLVVYHGTPLGGFDTFKRQQNYFTSMKWYADRYQDESASSNYIPDKHESPATKMTYAVFLNIKKPFDTRNKKERGIFEKEFYRQWGYGAPLSEKGLPDWTDGDDLQEFFEEKGYEYDGLILDEGGIPDNNGGVISRGISYVSFEPNQIKSATKNNGAYDYGDANIYHQSAWHGTPHDFDGFDLGAIGTGEGAQAHGWGLYFAQNRRTSEWYKKRLAKTTQEYYAYDGKEHKEYDYKDPISQALSLFKNRGGLSTDGKRIAENLSIFIKESRAKAKRLEKLAPELGIVIEAYEKNPNITFADLYKVSKSRTVKAIMKEVPLHKVEDVVAKLRRREELAEQDKDMYEGHVALFKLLDPKKITFEKRRGSLFEVEIPDNDVLLDEQKPFDEQPKFVKEKLEALVTQHFAQERMLDRLSEKDGRFDDVFQDYCAYLDLAESEDADARKEAAEKKEAVDAALEKLLGGEPLARAFLRTFTDGREIYQMLGRIHSARQNDKAASLALNEVGIKGITYDGRRDGRCFVIFDDKAIQIIEKFNQQMNEVIKGTTQDIPNGQRIISLFEAADESTFLHEMGHLFLLDLEHLAPMSPTAEKDLATVKKWAEWREGQATEYKGTPFAHSFAELDKKIRAALSAGNDRRADNLKRQWEHERFARGFEMYLKTGDAPTKGLRAVFAKFRAFLQRVYQAFTGTGGKATPEVEAVMARMISIEDSSDLSAYPRGKETEVYTDSGKSIPVQYRVVSADDLITSHDASALEINPGYPSALQPRDRERVVMRQQVERMSNTLRPEELGEGRNLNQGAPLIRSDGVVLNGNGRTIAIVRAQARNKERAAAYRNYLMENAETFGLSREAVARVDNPVLVREVQGDISADTMNDIIGSTTGGSRIGASENAQADADKLTHTVMDTYVPNEKGDLTTAANRDFVAGVLHKIVGQGELNAYLDKDGHVNADGIQRVKRALFAAAYGDDEIVAKMAESTDDDTRNVSNGLMAAAPMMARLSVKKDVPHIRELRDAIADAVKQLDTLRRSGESVKDYLGAQALFSEHEDSAEMREILSFLDENKRSGKRIGNYFTHIAESLDGMENPTDSDLFETQLPSLMDVLEEAKTHAETGGQDGLFGDNAQEVTDKNTQSEHLPDAQSPKSNAPNDPADVAQEEAEGKQEPTLGLFFQTEPTLEDKAVEYGAKSENGKVTFTDAAQEKEFLKVAKALLSAGARKFSKAWTGSAADYDAPSLDYVGTGTGGAAYGYGLYYAEKRKTAEGYGDKLYHAEIPDADVLLDTGKSFDAQPPKVRKALEKLVRGLTLEQLENWNDVRRMGKAKVVAEIMDALSEADGTNIYGTISDLAGGQKEASELLNKYGVKGAVYNDEQNGRTFVVFDDKAIKILEKFSARRQEEIKKMLDGITLVSPNRLSPRKRALRDWGHEMGVPVVFFKGDPSLHGFHSDGVTFLNVDSEITPQWTFWHEAMHWMKANNPDLYNDIVHEISGAEGFTKKQLDAYRKEIGAEHMSDADVIEEMIADALPDVRRRVPLLRDVGKRDTGIVERLVAWVHDVMRRFHDHFFTPKGGLTNDQRRAMVRAFGNLVGSIRDADGKQIFRVANDGARITLRDGKALPAVKYSLDKAGREGDNERKRNASVEARNQAITDSVTSLFRKEVDSLKESGLSEQEITRVLDDKNSNLRMRVLAPWLRQYNQFQARYPDKRGIVNRIEGRDATDRSLSNEEISRRFDTFKARMERMMDDAGLVYAECAYQRAGRPSFAGFHSWQRVEQSIREHGGSAEFKERPTTGHKNSLNTKHLESQGAFSMPKFSARTNGESRVGNFRRMMDALKSGVKPSPRVEVHDGRREVTADIGVSQVKRFMKDKRLTDDEVISRRELPNGKVRITYYARSAMDIGYADQAKSVRQVAKRNPFVKALYDLASKAMHKQEKLRNDFAKSLKEFAKLVKNPADMEKVTEILWTGDATGKEYTSAELRAAGVSDNVVRAYALVRRELKKAYELLNETRMQVKTRSKVLRPEDVESYMQSHWIRPSDVLSKTQTQDGNIELTWRGGKTYETKNKLMSAEELSLMEKDENINVTRAVPANAKAYGAGMYHVGYVERIKPINNLTGYMPHFFHEWMVYEQYKDPVSKEIRYTSVGSGRTLNEAVKIGNTIAEKNKDRNYVVRPKGFDMDAGNAVVVGDMEFAQMAKKLTESTQMSLSDARTFLRESAGATLKSRHRFFGNMMKRKGAEGFDKNIMWVLAHYFNSSARYIAMEEFKPAAISFYERCFGAFDSDTKNMTARYCKDLINDVNGNPRGVEVWLNDLIKGTWLGKRIADSYGDRAALAVNGELSTWNAITKLGLFNFASAAVNFSQFINVGAALNDYGYAAKGLLRALHPSALDEKIIEASGLLEDINLAADNGGYSQRRGGRAGTVYQKAKQFGEWTLTPFQKADTLMRKAAVLGAYYQGVEKKGMEKAPGDELSAKAIAYAQQINDDANFDYSAANAPGMLRAGSVITQQLFQFQKYPIMQFEFMYNILKNGTRGQKVRMLVPYVLFCGIGGSIPFGELFNQLFSFLFGIATGDDEDIARDIKAEILRWAGKDPVKKSVAETALYGVLAPTFGLDISGRIGMSNAFSGEFYGQKPDSVSGVVAQQLGGPMAATAINMLHQAHEGNPIEALKAVSPALGNMAQAYVGVSRTTHHRVNTRYDSAYDKIAHALGFRSVEESTNAFVMNYDYEMRTKDKHTKQDAIQSYIDDPSDANRRTLNALGITDRQVKEAKIQQERTAKERAKNGRPNTNGKNRSSQHKKEVKRETLLSATDDEE